MHNKGGIIATRTSPTQPPSTRTVQWTRPGDGADESLDPCMEPIYASLLKYAPRYTHHHPTQRSTWQLK